MISFLELKTPTKFLSYIQYKINEKILFIFTVLFTLQLSKILFEKGHSVKRDLIGRERRFPIELFIGRTVIKGLFNYCFKTSRLGIYIGRKIQIISRTKYKTIWKPVVYNHRFQDQD